MAANICPVCLEIVGKRNGYRHKQQHNSKSPCSAVYHKQCMVKATTELRMKKNAACPYCRLPVQHKEIESLAGRTIEKNNHNVRAVLNPARWLEGPVVMFVVRNVPMIAAIYISSIISLGVRYLAITYNSLMIASGFSIKDSAVYGVYAPQNGSISLVTDFLSNATMVPIHMVSWGVAKMIFLRNRQQFRNYCMFVAFSALCSVYFSEFARCQLSELMNR